MKFIHFADSHLDGFRDKKLSLLGLDSFKFVINFAIEKKVDFVVLSGDLFNTAIPRLDVLKFVTFQLKKLQENNIPVYAIPGSHDFSPQGKSIFEVLEIAGLLVNVMKGSVKDDSLQLDWIVDPKTGALLSGINGKKGMLDKHLYRDLNTSLLQSREGFKIFLFHISLSELKPKDLELMDSYSVNILPKNCDYYAGGHVHIVDRYNDKEYSNVIYPGPTFPNNFSELEKLGSGSFVFYDSVNDDPVEFVKVPSKKVLKFSVNVGNKSASEVSDELISLVSDEFLDKIILLRLSGVLESGSFQDLNLDEFIKEAYSAGAYVVLKNSSKVQLRSFAEDISLDENSENVELESIESSLDQVFFEGDEKESINNLINSLNIQQIDGEKKSVFLERVIDSAKGVLEK